MDRNELLAPFENLLSELFNRLEAAVQRGVYEGMLEWRERALEDRGTVLQRHRRTSQTDESMSPPPQPQARTRQPAQQRRGGGLQKAYDFVVENPGMTAAQAEKACGVHTEALRRLVRKGLIRKEGAYPARFYPIEQPPGEAPTEVEHVVTVPRKASTVPAANASPRPLPRRQQEALGYVRENPGTTGAQALREGKVFYQTLRDLAARGHVRKEGQNPARFFPVEQP
jgi:hypothetical protein